MRGRIAASLVLLLVSCGEVERPDAGRPDAGRPDAGGPPPAALRAAAVSLDITPEPGIEIVGYQNRISTGVRDPLEAAVLLLEHERTRIAIVTFDMPGVSDWRASMIRQRVSLAVRAPIEGVIVTASHTHSAPMLTGDDWSTETMDRIVAAAEELPDRLAPATLAYGEATIDFPINRRRVVDGVAEYLPNPDGPNDQRVRVLRVRDEEGALLATVAQAVCHPNIIRGPFSSVISADFVGDARAMRGDAAPWLFLQGAAGDIRAAVLDETGEMFREGTDEDIARAGAELARAVAEAPETPVSEGLAAGRRSLPVGLSRGGETSLELSAFRIGELLLVTIPGEPMVEIGHHVEDAVQADLGEDVVPIVVGYTNGYADYIVTEEARQYGGYEVRRSDLVPEATGQLEAALVEMAVEVAR